MKQKDIQIGKVYMVKVSGGLRRVRILEQVEQDRYQGRDIYSGKSKYRKTVRFRGVNLSTNREIWLTAARCRCEAAEEKTP